MTKWFTFCPWLADWFGLLSEPFIILGLFEHMEAHPREKNKNTKNTMSNLPWNAIIFWEAEVKAYFTWEYC